MTQRLFGSRGRGGGGSIVYGGLIVYTLYAEDFLDFMDNPSLCQSFKEDFRKSVV